MAALAEWEWIDGVVAEENQMLTWALIEEQGNMKAKMSEMGSI